jgi:SHS2 domain-containing protein
MKYQFIEDLTSDILFEAYGKNIKELFENSAEALFSVICKIKEIEPKQKIEFEFSGEDLDGTLYNFLSNLLAESEIAELFLSKFNVQIKKENSQYKGKVVAYGEPITPEKGETVVKAITYYKFKVEKNGIYKAKVSCDI